MMMTILVIAFMAVIGLVFDGGGKIAAMQRADTAAAEAARAAGQHITGTDLLGGSGLDRSAAVAAARNYLDAAGVHGTVGINGDTITVNTRTRGETRFLSIIGITSFQATGEATVQITTGM